MTQKQTRNAQLQEELDDVSTKFMNRASREEDLATIAQLQVRR